MLTDADVRGALGGVFDPCSVAAGRPTSLVDMGLLIGWALEAGELRANFAVTFAGCTMAPHFLAAAKTALAALPGVARVECVVDTGFAWGPDRMSRPRAMAGTPQAWRGRVSPAVAHSS